MRTDRRDLPRFNKLRLAQVAVSWVQAIDASDKYNLWLRKNAADKLPKEDGALGFAPAD